MDQTLTLANFGDDYIAGGGGNDEIFGQLGDDTIQGDGSIAGKITESKPVAAGRDVVLSGPDIIEVGTLKVRPSFEAATDGDDYIEGNGGKDVIFGNLGQDDIVGGNSNLFSLTTADRRPDGSDLIFGGAGTDIARNDEGDATASGHARDADMILGDNGNIYRLVGMNGTNGGAYLSFNYDTYNTLKIIPRAAQLLDYTPGGPDYNAAAATDIGGGDELHGESSDDFLYGMLGDDVLFGEGQDDDLIGGYGNDWFSGGTGDDGVLGDDGRIYTSRNSSTTGEPLYGVIPLLASDPNSRVINGNALDEVISTPGSIQQATINVSGQLKKTVNLTPFSVDPDWMGETDEFDGLAVVPHHSDDIIYGGWGNDWLHGGSGADAMSGAEALAEFYGNPSNPGDVLGYGDEKAGEFVAYDEFEPLRKVQFNRDGELWKPGDDPNERVEFLLNFSAGEGPKVGTVNSKDFFSDGNDRIFGDLGNDWMVGGTGRDDLYGGWGNDLLNADDDHDSTLGTADPTANNIPDTHPTYEDRAYGGAGRDVLIGNTGGDRLIDWVGEFDSFLVPFAPFGAAAVSRTLQPQLAEFLYALSASDGADPTRTADVGASADPARNGEPRGELGLVRQQDFAWQEQTGAPRDVQAGNIPGGARDVLRSASFDNGSTSGFFADSGKWLAQNGVLQVSAESLGGDAVSVFHVGDALPGYFEVQASVMAIKPTGGWKANSYMIFDYQGKDDFKFAGLDVSINKLVMGHRDASGWHIDEQAPFLGGVKADQYYNMLLAVNGVNATLLVDNKQVFTHTYLPRVVDGYSYGLNWGMVGVGSDNSRGAFDNIRVQILPPQVTFDQTEDFSDGIADLFTGYSNGAWSVSNGRYGVTPSGTTGMSLLDLGPDNLDVSSYLELNAKVSTAGRAGFIFDRYGDVSFKFAAIDAVTDQVIIGHYTAKGGWVSDAVVSKVIDSGTEYTLGVALKGSTVSVTLNGQVVLGYAFNATTVDGHFGLMAAGGTASFDDVRVKTNDPAFRTLTTANLIAAWTPAAGTASVPALTLAELTPIIDAAIARWGAVAGPLADVAFRIADLPDGVLGQTVGSTVVIDSTAAGYGWFLDPTPADDLEFRRQGPDGELVASPSGPAYGLMDLLTVVGHELGHILGLEDQATEASLADVMASILPTGVRHPIVDAGSAIDHGSGPSRPAGSGQAEIAAVLLFNERTGRFHAQEEQAIAVTFRGSEAQAGRDVLGAGPAASRPFRPAFPEFVVVASSGNTAGSLTGRGAGDTDGDDDNPLGEALVGSIRSGLTGHLGTHGVTTHRR